MERSPDKPFHVLIGVCGGIAAYKAAEAVSRFRKEGCEVTVAMTEAACRFVAPLTFAALSGRAVLDRLLPDGSAGGQAVYPHLFPASDADAFIVMPATAHTIAKLASGWAGDVVSACALSLRDDCLKVFCPAMNSGMWCNPAVQRNSRLLEERGWVRLGPERGLLACGTEGEGRMVEPAAVVDAVLERLRGPLPLKGRRVLILSGPTREYIDPVRFISNGSSGKMGRALAEVAAEMGAEVSFVSGPVSDGDLPRAARIEIRRVVSAQEMLEAARAEFDRADVVIFAAAVADWRPKGGARPDKLPKGAELSALELEPTPDIAAQLNAKKKPGQVAIGFALQTGDGRPEARQKLYGKAFDAIVLNGPEAIGGERGRYYWIDRAGGEEEWGVLGKRACAREILGRAVEML